jgi:hypothetical protein
MNVRLAVPRRRASGMGFDSIDVAVRVGEIVYG